MSVDASWQEMQSVKMNKRILLMIMQNGETHTNSNCERNVNHNR